MASNVPKYLVTRITQKVERLPPEDRPAALAEVITALSQARDETVEKLSQLLEETDDGEGSVR